LSHRFPFTLALVVAALALPGCNGPFLLLPGGELDGEPARPPSDWTFAGTHGMAQLETRPEDAYSVNIAYTILNDHLYINAGDTESQWAKNIAADQSVRLRMSGTLYALRAERVTDAAEIGRFGQAWTDQSMFRRDPAGLDEVWLFRLVAR